MPFFTSKNKKAKNANNARRAAEENALIAKGKRENERNRQYKKYVNNLSTRRNLFNNNYLKRRGNRALAGKLEKNPFNKNSNNYGKYVKCINDGKHWHSNNKCSRYPEGSNADKCERAGGSWQGGRCD